MLQWGSRRQSARRRCQTPFLTYTDLDGEFGLDLFELDTSGFTMPTGDGFFELRHTPLETGGVLAIGYVPEPGAWLLLLSALACGLLVRRR